MAHNLIDILDARLSNIENILLALKHPPQNTGTAPLSFEFKYLPIIEIFRKKICSKPTFYKHLKKGEFHLYKFGNKSFVDKEEFLSAFHKVKITNK